MKLSNRIITTDRTPIFFGNDAVDFIDRFLLSVQQDYRSKQVMSADDVSPHPMREIFILVDPETRTHCLPLLQTKSLILADAAVLEIPGGEDSKSLIQAEKLWNALLAAGAGRNCLLVNLGGGVVSDLGGFIAAGYKRGISYINIPTTLMGQADAAIGGKTAVNLGHIKNQIGFFHAPKAVFIYPGFLHTLPEAHLRSGLAEIIKSILISDAAHWRRLVKHPVGKILHLPTEGRLWLNLIEGSVKFKNRIVMQDYRERKLRKVLNFGHTVGHAVEGFSQSEPGKQLLHGEAVAAGMKCAAFLSHRKAGLSRAGMEEIIGYLDDGFPSYPLDIRAKAVVMELMTHDKKNRNGEVMFTLISEPGHPKINIACDRQDILEALDIL